MPGSPGFGRGERLGDVFQAPPSGPHSQNDLDQAGQDHQRGVEERDGQRPGLYGEDLATVTYAALAPADAKNRTTSQQMVIVVAVSNPWPNR
ncbi:MAG: hypothetical protein ACTHPS_22690 [Streptosporangiaceae bacterium]